MAADRHRASSPPWFACERRCFHRMWSRARRVAIRSATPGAKPSPASSTNRQSSCRSNTDNPCSSIEEGVAAFAKQTDDADQLRLVEAG